MVKVWGTITSSSITRTRRNYCVRMQLATDINCFFIGVQCNVKSLEI